MAETYKPFGQSNPSANTPTTLYTVPAATQAIGSLISIANLAATDTTFRLAIRIGGEALAQKQYLAYDSPLKASDAIYLNIAPSLQAGDVVTVQAGSSTVAFGMFGTELT